MLMLIGGMRNTDTRKRAGDDFHATSLGTNERTNTMSDNNPQNPLEKLRAPFAANHISKLPKPTKAQTDAVRADFKKGIRCTLCGAWHHPDVIHLDYVGHAAATDRLLDTDIEWTWEPLSVDEHGLPAFDRNGGLWIKLTVCGVTRLGYGSADGKTGGDAIKEIIGDAIRNSGMRFGMALDLWHKGDLHADEEPEKQEKPLDQFENGSGRQKREPLKGKHKTREAMRQAAGSIAKALEEAADGGDDSFIDTVLEEWKESIDQIREEGPASWWSNGDFGLEAQIAKARQRIAEGA